MTLQALLDHWILNPRWRTIRVLGEVRVLVVSVTFLVAFPLFSQLVFYAQVWLRKTADTVSKIQPGTGEPFTNLADQIGMPLVLKLLALTAVFAFMGKIVYEFCCPPYIRAGDSFARFRHSNSRALTVLEEDFRKLWNTLDKETLGKIRAGLRSHHVTDIWTDQGLSTNEAFPITDNSIRFSYIKDNANRGETGSLRYLLGFEEIGGAVFTVLGDLYDDSRKWARIICALSYYLALLCAVIAIAVQGKWVLLGVLN